jgi:hypothetical protein
LLWWLPTTLPSDERVIVPPDYHIVGQKKRAAQQQQQQQPIMENTLIPQGIEIVQKAIAADGEGDYEKALALYRDALSRFTIGLKYEKNEARKKLVMERVEGYMKRAEELSDYLKKQSELDKGGAGGVASRSKKGGEGDDADAETKKLRGALSSAIVSEKPNIHWDDVAGLANAKESLKEVRTYMTAAILPLWSCPCCHHGGAAILCFVALTLRCFYNQRVRVCRRSFYPPSSHNSLRANASRSKGSSSTVPPEPVRPPYGGTCTPCLYNH